MNRLVTLLSRLPGIGKRSAERVVFYLLKSPPEEAMQLAAAIEDLKRNARQCSTCFNLAESDPCPICADPRRDHSVVMVVEQPSDVATIETSGAYRGVYHVLMGRLSPLDGVGPGDLTIHALTQRLDTRPGHAATKEETPVVREVVIGTSPTLEGDGTGLYLAQLLGKHGVKVTRLARGLPTGSTLELASKAVLADSIQGRQPMPAE